MTFRELIARPSAVAPFVLLILALQAAAAAIPVATILFLESR